MVFKGYDKDTGDFKVTLNFEAIRLDDYGFYECLSEDQKKVIKSFSLYINSTSNILLPKNEADSGFISVNAGMTAHVPCRLLNPTLSKDINLKLISSSTGSELPNVLKKDFNDGFEIYNARHIFIDPNSTEKPEFIKESYKYYIGCLFS